LRWALVIITTIILAPVISQFFIELAEEAGLYDSPSSKVRIAMEWLRGITDNAIFWFVFPLIVGSTIGVWIYYFLQQLKITIIYPNIPTSVRLQFTAGSLQVTQLANENTNNTLTVRETFDCGSGVVKMVWYVFMTFNKPTHYGQVIVDAGRATIPEWHVTSHTNYSAVVRFDGDIGNVALTIKTISPNP